MARSEAVVSTSTAGRYLAQLCKHWSHRFPVTFDAREGHIDFDGSDCVLKAEDVALRVTVQGPDADLDRLQGVVAAHLNRFAHRESELVFAWRRVS